MDMKQICKPQENIRRKNDIGFGMVLYHMSLIDSFDKGFEGHLVAKISNEFQ